MICPNCHSEFESAPSCPHCGMIMFKDSAEAPPEAESADKAVSRSIILQGQWNDAQDTKRRSGFDSIYKYLVVGLLALIAIIETARFIVELF